MLNAETKRHIDAARDVLVGVAPNPMTQIDQITYALIYKFMDDMDQAAIKAGGEPSFFVGELEPYSWSKLVDARMGNQEKMNLYGEALQKFSEAKQLPELFRTIFRAAFLPYRSPETLGLFLKEINYFDYTHPEELGNAYEYLLSIMSAQGDAGQFRTPRHIIDFMVDVMNPTKDDKVLDPACGTGGFLVASYNHILEQHDGKDDPNKKEKPLTPDERKKLMANFEGYDIDPSMVRIAQVNMYLHQFKNPKIFQYDSLTSEERWNDKFDVILANPPFMSPKGGIKPHNKFAIQSNRSEVLFVDYIANHLKPNGRAAIIVPEGIIFQSGKAYKQLRKDLVEGGLYAVVSLPSGVFNPYSGVKTSILLINNEIAKQKDEILFVKISNDGFDLGATKRPIEKNDIPAAISVLSQWTAEDLSETELAQPILKSEIASTTDFNLNGDRYRKSGKQLGSVWPLVQLGEVAEVISGQSPEGKFYNETGEGIPFYQGKTEFTDKWIGVPTKWTTSVTKTALRGDILMSVRAPVGPVNIAPIDLCIGRGLAAIRPHSINRDFLFYILKSQEKSISGNGGAVFDSINRLQIETMNIPLPPHEVQEQLVAELDSYAAIIEGAKKIVENWKPRIDVDPEWEVVELGSLCSIGSSKRVFESEWQSSGVPFYRAREIIRLSKQGFVDNELFISENMYAEYAEKYGIPKAGDLMVTGVGTLGVSYMVKEADRFYFKDGNIIWMSGFDSKVRSEFVHYLFSSDYIISQIKATAEGGTVGTYTITNAKATKVPLPSIEIQDAIISEVRAEQQMVRNLEDFQKGSQNRMNRVIESLWSS